MSGGTVVSVQGGVGGIEARTSDMRALAAMLWFTGSSVQGEADQVSALTSLFAGELLDGLIEEVTGLGHTAAIADGIQDLGRLVRSAADSYDDVDAWNLERLLGAAYGALKNTVKAQVQMRTFGVLDVPWEYDLRPLEALSKVYDLAPFSTVMMGFALLVDWRTPPQVTRTGIDRSGPAARPPGSVADLLQDLEHRNAQEPGAIDVQVLQFDDGRPRQVIVNLPGTSTLVPTLHNPTDMAANLLAIEGQPTAYGEGVIDALDMAGVTAADQVLLVGHSQGGMVAAALAAQLAGSGRFAISNVVTVGSPIARIDIPRNVQVLALENRNDPVPQMDGGRNEDSVDIVTVTVDTDRTGLDAHGIESGYLPAAEALEDSGDPSVRRALDDLAPYLDADRVTTHTFRISR
jgi:hypothetical protein